MILAVWLLVCAAPTGSTPPGCAPPGGQGNRHWRGQLEVRGPVESIRLDFGAHGTTRVERPLARRESAVWSVPAPLIAPLGVADLERRSEPEISVVGEGSAVWLGWSEPQPLPPAPGIRARGRPPQAGGVHPDGIGAVLVIALFLTGLALRRRPRTWSAIAGLGAVGILGLAALRPRPPSGVSVLEVDGARPTLAWELRADSGPLALGERDWLEVETGVALEFRVGEAGVEVHASRGEAQLFAWSPRPLLGRLEPWSAANPWGEMQVSWGRSGAGNWRTHGPWADGAPWRPGPGSEGAPPGWLAAGLPQGPALWIGRRKGLEPPGWVRVVGFASESH